MKPSLFKNEILGTADPLYTILFECLWCLADRDGRLEDRPMRIKVEAFPYREGIDTHAMLSWLHDNKFILRYQRNGEKFIQIINFHKHQNPHVKENKSTIPAPGKNGASTGISGTDRADSLNPLTDSLNPLTLTLEKKGRFAPPSLDEIKSYCSERKNGINAKSFLDFYESKGWMIGKNKMKDWKAAVRTWEQREPKNKMRDEFKGAI